MPLAPVTPPGLAPPAANYHHAVLVTGASRWLHTSGIVPARPDGSVPDGVAAQAEVVWENILALLTEADMTTADVVSMVTYVVEGNDLAAVMAVRDRAMAGQRAASTLVLVPSLARPAWLLEIRIVAAR